MLTLLFTFLIPLVIIAYNVWFVRFLFRKGRYIKFQIDNFIPNANPIRCYFDTKGKSCQVVGYGSGTVLIIGQNLYMRLVKDPDDAGVLGLLYHELSHVKHRHNTTRGILNANFTGLIYCAVALLTSWWMPFVLSVAIEILHAIRSTIRNRITALSELRADNDAVRQLVRDGRNFSHYSDILSDIRLNTPFNGYPSIISRMINISTIAVDEMEKNMKRKTEAPV